VEPEQQHNGPVPRDDEPAMEELRQMRIAAIEGSQQPTASVLGNRSHDDQDEAHSVKRPGEGPTMNDNDLTASPSTLVFGVASALGKRRSEVDTTAGASKHQKTAAQTLTECRGCTDPVEQAYAGPCGHSYCRSCVNQIFQLAMKDETCYPPRCCRQPFPVDQVKHHLEPTFYQAYLEKREELEDKDRLYCHVATCSTYIGNTRRSQGTQSGLCPRAECAHLTCLTCHGAQHQGKCPDDEDTKVVLEIAKKEGWQRCQPCGRMLELVSLPTMMSIWSMADLLE
jgi:hypothetical protein